MRLSALSRLVVALVVGGTTIALVGGSAATAAPAPATGDGALAPAAVTAPYTALTMTSAVGDPVGAGRTYAYLPPDATISAVTFRGQLQVRVNTDTDFWQLDFTAPPGQLLVPGQYPNAEKTTDVTGHAPGVDVRGNYAACGEVFGSFALDQLEADSDGTVTTLEMSFLQRCSQGGPALRGNIYFAGRPLSYRYTSEASDPIGLGASQTFTGSDSVFGTSSGVDNIQIGVSGHRQVWTLNLTAPIGGTLAPGTYRTTRTRTATTAGLDVSNSRTGVACNTSAGTLTVREVRLNTDGQIIAIDASFVQRCTGLPQPAGALRGVIRLFAGSFPPPPTPTA